MTDRATESLARDCATELGLQVLEVQSLAGGGGNTSLRLRCVSDDIVVRCAGASAGLGVDRGSELALASVAAAAGLAPAVLLARPGQGLLITRYLSAGIAAPGHWSEPATLRRMADWLARLHRQAVTPAMVEIRLFDRAAHALSQLPATEATVLAAQLRARQQAAPVAAAAVPCHHDLHAGNLREHQGRIFAIDWEYGGAGDAAADLAAFASYQALDAGATALLVEAYLAAGGRTTAAAVAAQRWAFDCLCYGWAAQAAAQGMATLVDRGQLRQRLLG